MSEHRARLLLILSVAVTLAPSRPFAAEGNRPPNILVILVDDLGYGDLSSYGAQDLRTPQIDSLGARGMRFENFYANCPVCSPTRASLLAGTPPDLVGVPGVIRTYSPNSWGYLAPDITLVSDTLRRQGYHTGLVGKWHLGLESPNTPLERGFMTFHGFLGDMMDDYYHHRRRGINYMRRGVETIDPEGHATDLFSAWAIAYLKDRKREGSPFFLYLAYNAPHTPIQPPPEWLEKIQAREPNVSPKRARLIAFIEHLDDGIGKVLHALEETEQAKNTLVFFTSDNGGQLNVGANCGPFRGGKQDMYEGGLRVPAYAVWPGRIAPGSRTERVSLTMDIFPTLCEVVDVRPPPTVTGASFLSALTGAPEANTERDLVWVRREGGSRYVGQDYYAVRRGPWKLVHNTPFEPLQLYQLEKDPKETEDVIGQEPEVARQLLESLRRHAQRAGRVPWQRP
jgi:arylsulfatase A-like enzyme